MDGRTASVLALSLVGLGASAAQTATAARTAARRRRDAVLSSPSAAAALCRAAAAGASAASAAPAADPTHRDGDAGSSELLRRFQESGYVIVADVFSKAEMAEWKAKITDHLSQWPQSSVDPSTGREVSAAVTGVSVWMAMGEDPSSPIACPPYFVDALTSPKLGAILRELLGGGQVELLSTKPVLKTGKISHASPWHQDWPYWQGTNKLSLWVAIDDASVENGCLKVVPETHDAALPHEKHTEAIAFDSRVSASSISDEQVL